MDSHHPVYFYHSQSYCLEAGSLTNQEACPCSLGWPYHWAPCTSFSPCKCCACLCMWTEPNFLQGWWELKFSSFCFKAKSLTHWATFSTSHFCFLCLWLEILSEESIRGFGHALSVESRRAMLMNQSRLLHVFKLFPLMQNVQIHVTSYFEWNDKSFIRKCLLPERRKRELMFRA